MLKMSFKNFCGGNFYEESFYRHFYTRFLFFTIGCGNVSENQREETIFDNKAEALIGNLKLFAARGNFNLSEPKISNVDNQKFCTVNFGDSDKNIVNFKLNDDDSVINAEIIVNDANNYEFGKMAGLLLSGTLMSIGVEQEELQKFLTSYQKSVEEEIRKQNNTATPIIDSKFKVHCAATKKDLNVGLKSDDKQMKYVIEVAK